jgi:hypothetical protein
MRIYVFLFYKIKTMIDNLTLSMEYLLLAIGLIIVIVLYKKHNDNDYFNEN